MAKREGKLDPAEWLTGDLPPKLIDGEPNADYFRALSYRAADLSAAVMSGEREMPKGLNLAQLESLITTTAKSVGFDPKRLFDHRSEMDKAEDVVQMILSAPEKVFEAADDELDAVLAAMDSGFDKTKKAIDERIEDATEEFINNPKRRNPFGAVQGDRGEGEAREGPGPEPDPEGEGQVDGES